jgi:hypothetical protein
MSIDDATPAEWSKLNKWHRNGPDQHPLFPTKDDPKMLGDLLKEDYKLAEEKMKDSYTRQGYKFKTSWGDEDVNSPAHYAQQGDIECIDAMESMLSREEINPIFTFGEGEKEKLVNAHGVWCFIASLITGPIWLLAMAIVGKKGEKDVNKAEYDNTGKIWSKAWLTAINSYPTVSGNLERLKAGNDEGACLFVANHASWLDIPVLCTVLDPVFKFIAKGELAKVPCIGTQLSGVGNSNFGKKPRVLCR